ncbi:hypothetical protein F904_02676 [Acinetobacter dispersus]|uniref:Uncharacterized protein n=2 Tax=Acinetobacter TaxID=469 RepID=N8UX02_9GAMM|nr:hypothetical protein F971_02003 [Acinetobacter vivianii]ENW92733.1 hypothetical protein F904_02676 [Acinetobacter dispersus]
MIDNPIFLQMLLFIFSGVLSLYFLFLLFMRLYHQRGFLKSQKTDLFYL